MARIIEKITLNDVRECLDDLNFNSKFHRDKGIIVSWFSADNDFPHDVALLFRIEGDNNDWLKLQARAQDQYIPTEDGGNELVKAYVNANQYNSYRRYGRAYVDRDTDDGTFFYVFEENLVADQPITYEFLLENIKIFCPSAWAFFKDQTI